MRGEGAEAGMETSVVEHRKCDGKVIGDESFDAGNGQDEDEHNTGDETSNAGDGQVENGDNTGDEVFDCGNGQVEGGDNTGDETFDIGNGQVEGGHNTSDEMRIIEVDGGADSYDRGEERVKRSSEKVNADEEQCGRYYLRSKKRRIQ